MVRKGRVCIGSSFFAQIYHYVLWKDYFVWKGRDMEEFGFSVHLVNSYDFYTNREDLPIGNCFGLFKTKEDAIEFMALVSKIWNAFRTKMLTDYFEPSIFYVYDEEKDEIIDTDYWG